MLYKRQKIDTLHKQLNKYENVSFDEKNRWFWIALLKNENLMFLKLSSERSEREKNE